MKRRKTCRFIEETGRVLKLPRVAVATAMVFFHRFYAKHSFQQHDRFEVAVASMVLAAKTEESPKKVNVVIDEAYKLKLRGMQAGRLSQGSSSQSAAAAALDPKGEEFAKLKERILLLERVILHTIGFELSIDHPYKFLVEQIKLLVNKRQIEFIQPPESSANLSTSQLMSQMMNKMVQAAMNFANDSMQTSLCLQFGPQKIATACVYLAGNVSSIQPTNQKSWLEVLGYPNVEALASISLQIMELMQDRTKGGGGPEQDIMDKLRQDIDNLRDSSSGSGGGGGGDTNDPSPGRTTNEEPASKKPKLEG